MVRDLRRELHGDGPSSGGGLNDLLVKQSGACAMRAKKPCCNGVGFKTVIDGAYVGAALCDCVLSCPVCFGKCLAPSGGHGGALKSCSPNDPRLYVTGLNNARIPALYADAALDRFANFTGNGRDLIGQLTQWLNTFSIGQSRGFILSGPVGVGKTYILAAITRALALRGLNVRFVDFFQLLSELRGAYAAGDSDLSLIQPLVDLDVLVIDEMGKGPSTEWPITILDQLVNGRDKQKKIILASTNYTIGAPRSVSNYASMDLEHAAASSPKGFSPDMFPTLESRVGSRVYSRLMGMCHGVEMTGQDWRRNGRGGAVPRR